MTDLQLLNFERLIDETLVYNSDLLPSVWYEQRARAPMNNALPKISYDFTPYWREPVDCFHPNHPARDITIMGPAQMGKSKMVLIPVVCYTISENPGNILFLTGQADLTKKAVMRLEAEFQDLDIAHLIRAVNNIGKNNRTGNTLDYKEFRGGTFHPGVITNHNFMRQLDIMVSLADDLDAGRKSKDNTGSTVQLIKGRTKAYESKCKRGWVSSPQVMGLSLIEDQFNKSDKRYFDVPCECCHQMIDLKFSISIDDKNAAGLHWKLDNLGRVDPKSVGYVCQLCAGFFTDKNKFEFMLNGGWRPTTEPKELFHYGYHINGLYAPHGMTSWSTLAANYVMCNPPEQPRKESEYQTFLNIDLGDLYEMPKLELKASELMKNIREYEAFTVPEDLSIKDGNGSIVMLTCGIDLNGRFGHVNKEDDVRLDWEILAWSESGSSYSVAHGSIGTFIPFETPEQKKIPREKWTYEHDRENSVWPHLTNILTSTFPVSGSNRRMGIAFTAMDTGYCERQAFDFIDSSNIMIVGVKGSPEDKYKPLDRVTPNFKQATTKRNLYILDGHSIKEEIAGQMQLKWRRSEETQPCAQPRNG